MNYQTTFAQEYFVYWPAKSASVGVARDALDAVTAAIHEAVVAGESCGTFKQAAWGVELFIALADPKPDVRAVLARWPECRIVDLKAIRAKETA